MPGRLLPDDFGEDLLEMNLSDGALTSYTFITRATDNYGCCKYNPVVIHSKAFKGRSTPSPENIKNYIDEYIRSGIVVKWKMSDGFEYIFFMRWFRDNYFKIRTIPSTPRPPSLANVISESAWSSGDKKAFSKLFGKLKKVSETSGKFRPEDEDEGEGEGKGTIQEAIDEVFDYYKKTVQPKIGKLPGHLKGIKKALKDFTIEQCKLACDNAMKDDFFLKNNKSKGAEWFFSTATRIERFIQQKPGKVKSDLRDEIDES